MKVHEQYDAAAYDVTELRRKYSRHRRGVAVAVGAALLGAGCFIGPVIKREAEEVRARFVARIIAEELGSLQEAGMDEKQLRLRIIQERARGDDLEERLLTVAAAVVID